MCTLLQCAVFYASYVAIVIAGVKSSNQNFATLFNETTGIINLRLPVVLPHFYFPSIQQTLAKWHERRKNEKNLSTRIVIINTFRLLCNCFQYHRRVLDYMLLFVLPSDCLAKNIKLFISNLNAFTPL